MTILDVEHEIDEAQEIEAILETLPTNTDDALVEMFKTNTGRALLDSGDAYGRNWERNQKRAFLNEPEVHFDTWGSGEDSEVYVRANTFQWLRKVLSYRPDLDARMVLLGNRSDESHMVDAEEFAEQNHCHEYSYGDREIHTFNTYNWENFLDETLQGVFFAGEHGEQLVALQYHGGCDVRGGYTRAWIFEVDGEQHELYDPRISMGHRARPVVAEQYTIDGKIKEIEEYGGCPLGQFGIDYWGSEVMVYRYDLQLDLYGDDIKPYMPIVNDDDEVVCRGCGEPMIAELCER